VRACCSRWLDGGNSTPRASSTHRPNRARLPADCCAESRARRRSCTDGYETDRPQDAIGVRPLRHHRRC
jgi:hypothetical protein